MHEFVNSGVEIPVTHVPAGSGNGFAKTQTVVAKEDCGVEESLFLVIKNRKKAFNLAVNFKMNLGIQT